MPEDKDHRSETKTIFIVLDPAIIGKEALLKTCYWFARDFSHEIELQGDGRFCVSLKPRGSATPEAIAHCSETFWNSAIDFELRSQIETRTSSIRELIVAKAFSAAGVLEDPPQGIFTDSVEESKPVGLFKILDSPKT